VRAIDADGLGATLALVLGAPRVAIPAASAGVETVEPFTGCCPADPPQPATHSNAAMAPASRSRCTGPPYNDHRPPLEYCNAR
jgi:hypothetical protein